MTESSPHRSSIPLALHVESVDGARDTNVATELRSRVVREARRETWFVVNDGIDELATLPIDLRAGAMLRRVEVNGEAADFSADEHQALVRPRRALRPGAGTIVILHLR